MSSLATPPSVLQARDTFRDRARSETCVRLHLRSSGDGWSLVAPSGELVFEAHGQRGRRRCLAFARAHGVLALFS